MTTPEEEKGYLRYPGKVCWTPLPRSLHAKLRFNRVDLVQSYKGHVLLGCLSCEGYFVIPVDRDADPSCPYCAREKFTEAVGCPRNPYEIR